MKYYAIQYLSVSEEFVAFPTDTFEEIEEPCIESAFQKLTHDSIIVETDKEEGGLAFPDFFEERGVSLFTPRIAAVLKPFVGNEAFRKPVQVKNALTKEEMSYQLILPPRIDALDWDMTKYEEESLDPLNPLREIENYVFSAKKIGRFHMFKLAYALDNRIFVTEMLKQALERENPKGMSFYLAGVVD